MSWLRRVALWAKTPGRDFERRWASWLLWSDSGCAAWGMVVEKPLARLCCWWNGHEIIDDQCNIPEHRYCLICNRGIDVLGLREKKR